MSDLVKYLGLPANVSSGREGVDHLILFVHILMVVLFIGWFSYFILVLCKFRKTKNPKASYAGVKNHASTWIEGLVAAIEAALLIGLAFPLWASAVEKFPTGKDVTTIKVMAQQFQWNGWYPGTNGVFVAQDMKFRSGDNPYGFDKKDPNFKSNFTLANDFVVPVNKPVVVYITSLDVIHSFAIRPMRVTQDAIPGMSIPAWFHPVKEGTYRINCVQLCGSSHYAMGGTIKVVSQAEYDKWMAKKTATSSGGGGYE